MNKNKQLIIHCGFHKTASSSIQHTLGDNRKKLEKLGYYYPDMIVEKKRFYNQSIPLYGFFTENPEQFQHYKFHNNLDPEQTNQQIDDILKNDIINHNRVIFSDEFISSLNSAELTKLKNRFEQMGFNIRLITFVRDPCNLATSMIQQRIANGTVSSLLGGIKKTQKSYRKIKALVDVFGSAIEFHCFEKACQFSGGPVAYFLDLLKIQDQKLIELRVINESRSNQAVRLISYINDNNPEFKTRQKGVFPLFGIKGEKFALTNHEFSQIEDAVINERAAISALLGDDFFMPINYVTRGGGVTWNEEQIDAVISTLHKLNKDIALQIYQYFYRQYFQRVSMTTDQLSKLARNIIKLFPDITNDINLPQNVSSKKSKFKKVILHVGPDKTGSTSIQVSLDKSRGLLLEHGVFYPLGAGANTTRHHVLGSCVTLESDMFVYNEYQSAQQLQKILKRDEDYLAFLKGSFNKVRADTLVLSCEGFSHLSETALERMRDLLREYCDEIEVVLYVRPPLSYASSALSELVKVGKGALDDNFFPAFPFQGIVKRLTDVFGKEQINLRLFEQSTLPKGNVVLDFLSLLNLPKSVQKKIIDVMPQQNSSLSAEARLIGNRMVELLDGYIPPGTEFRMTSGIGTKFLPRIKGRRFQLSDIQQQEILKASKPHIDYLNREFGFVLQDENLSPYKPLNISKETIDFAARVLTNVLVPDFDISTGSKRVQTGRDTEKKTKQSFNNIETTQRKKESKFKKAILHVGPDKTGSTSIQHSLNDSRELLLENGVLYPPGLRHHTLGSCFAEESELFSYNKVVHHAGVTIQEIQTISREYLHSFEEVLRETQADIVVLSCEGFVNLTEDAFNRMKLFLEQYCDTVEVVIYARAPLSYATSAMSQRVKTGLRVWAGQYMPVLIYQVFLEKLSRAFGKEQLNVRMFSKESLPKGNVVLDFLSLLDLPKSIEERVLSIMPRQNHSLSEEALLVGERMIELLDGYISFGPEFKNRIGIGREFLPRIKGRKIQLTNLQKKNILTFSAPHTEYLFREFGIFFKKEDSHIHYESLGLSEETIDFTARVLLNVLIPDFEISATDTPLKNGIKEGVKADFSLKLKRRIRLHFSRVAMRLWMFISPYPRLRGRIKSILIQLRIY